MSEYDHRGAQVSLWRHVQETSEGKLGRMRQPLVTRFLLLLCAWCAAPAATAAQPSRPDQTAASAAESASTSAAQPFETVGVRAAGLGGAFVAVADDASAIWWNPAGLASGALFSILLEYQDFDARSGAGLLIGAPAIGLGYLRTKMQLTPDASLITHQAGVTVVQTVAQGFTTGATVKFLRGIASRGPDDILGRASNSFDLDVGAMLVSGPLRAGITLRDLRQAEFEAQTGTPLRLERSARAGLAWMTDQWIAALDVDLTSTRDLDGARRMIAAGAERRWGNRAAARGGIRVSTDGERKPLGSIGGSIAVWSALWVDGQITVGSRETDRGWGVAGRIRF